MTFSLILKGQFGVLGEGSGSGTVTKMQFKIRPNNIAKAIKQNLPTLRLVRDQNIVRDRTRIDHYKLHLKQLFRRCMSKYQLITLPNKVKKTNSDIKLMTSTTAGCNSRTRARNESVETTASTDDDDERRFTSDGMQLQVDGCQVVIYYSDSYIKPSDWPQFTGACMVVNWL
jgi:hypothetical protein